MNAVETQRHQLKEMRMMNARIKAELESLRYKNTNVTLKANIDYTGQNNALQERIRQLESSIRDAKQGVIRKSIFGDSQM